MSDEPPAPSNYGLARVALGLDRLLTRIRLTMSPIVRSIWLALGSYVLLVTGLLEFAIGLLFLQLLGQHFSSSLPSVLGLYAAGGLGIAVAGFLTIFRRRRQLIHRLLGTLTTGSFALGLAFLSRDGGDAAADGMLFVALMFGGCLMVTLVFAEQIAEDSTLKG